jgi:hypothetical protein
MKRRKRREEERKIDKSVDGNDKSLQSGRTEVHSGNFALPVSGQQFLPLQFCREMGGVIGMKQKGNSVKTLLF